MPSLKVMRMQEVFAYECDAPSCREVCTAANGSACLWVAIQTPTIMHGPVVHASQVRPGERQQLWMCSWACLAEYACWLEEAAPLRTRESVAVTTALPF